ncbi:unnamed protein product [Clavelina lepadiformis]|uniref:Protein CUSTOS n=1 Tax=Clavelina lepadiformis TaxID=159417 RepID=A0ABP0G7R5_CLALP
MDSSDSEEDVRLREAVAPELIICMERDENDKKCLSNGKASVLQKQLAGKTSIRHQIWPDATKDNHFLNTTPEFRQHISKKLSLYLDSKIKMEDCQTKTGEKSIDNNNLDGIRLLHSSTKILVTDEEKKGKSPTRKRNITKVELSDSDSESEMRKLSEAVVSGDDVLNWGEGAFQIKFENEKPVGQKMGKDVLATTKDKSKPKKKKV